MIVPSRNITESLFDHVLYSERRIWRNSPVGGGGSDMDCSNVEALNRRILARNMLGQSHQDSCLERFGTYIHSVQLVRVSVQIHS